MTRERDESGQYVETVGPTDVLDVFGTVDGPVITSSDVADALDCTTEAARQKLGTLVAEGTLGVRKTGRTKVYWRDDDGPDDTAVAPLDADTDGTTDGVSLGDDVPERINDADARDAVAAAVDYVAEHGPVERGEIVNAVLPDHPLDYGTDVVPLESGDRYRGAWWRKVVKDGLEESGARYQNGVGWDYDADGGEDRD